MRSRQRYISDELTHFAGKEKKTHDEQYEVLSNILRSKELASTTIKFKPHGLLVNPNGKLSKNNQYTFNTVCFCDIPLGDIEIHIKKYSPFGLSFKKDFIVSNGGSPVYYVPKNSTVNHYVLGSNKLYDTKADYFDEMYRVCMDLVDPFKYKIAHESQENAEQKFTTPLNLLTFFGFHIFGHIKFFDHRLKDDDPENYYFEREWRILGSLQFKSEDVQRILFPKTYARKFREDFPEYFCQITFTDFS